MPFISKLDSYLFTNIRIEYETTKGVHSFCMNSLGWCMKYTNEKKSYITVTLFSVGVAGFEPTTPCSQSRCANRTALHPESFYLFL